MPDPDTSALLTLVLLMAVEVIGIALWGLMSHANEELDE